MRKDEKQTVLRTLKNYQIMKKIGAGSWAIVYKALDTNDNKIVAIKQIPKTHLEENPKVLELLKTQIQVLKDCRNQNVIGFIQSFKTDKTVCIVMEYCNGGDLEDYLVKKKRLLEDEAVAFLKQILNGFKGLHEIGAMHRDFKSANVMLHNGMCKVADLGFAKQMRKSQLQKKAMLNTILGTSTTMAPQVLEQKPYSYEADIWSIGVVFYQLLYGKQPYNGRTDYDILKKIKTTPVKFQGVNISDESKDFIERCLTVDVSKRMHWSEIYEHPLLKESEKINEMVYGTLKSKIKMDVNRSFYEQKKNMKENNVHYEERMRDIIADQVVERKGEKEDLRKSFAIFEQAEQSMKEEQKFLQHEKAYLSARNIAMFVFKFVVPNFQHYTTIKANHYVAMFIISKKAYLDLKSLRDNVIGERNIFHKQYFEDFLNTPTYKEIQRFIEKDMKETQHFAEQCRLHIKMSSMEIEQEFEIDKVRSKNFQQLVRAIIEQYWVQLAEGLGSVRNHSKNYLIRSLEALYYYNNNNTIDSEQFDRNLSESDFVQLEKEIWRRYEKKM